MVVALTVIFKQTFPVMKNLSVCVCVSVIQSETGSLDPEDLLPRSPPSPRRFAS